VFELLGAIVVLAAVGLAGYLIIHATSARQHQTLSRSRSLALEVGDQWYPQALRMARLLERLLADDLVRCTIPAGQQEEIAKTLALFWADD